LEVFLLVNELFGCGCSLQPRSLTHLTEPVSREFDSIRARRGSVCGPDTLSIKEGLLLARGTFRSCLAQTPAAAHQILLDFPPLPGPRCTRRDTPTEAAHSVYDGMAMPPAPADFPAWLDDIRATLDEPGLRS
jgi:hypothetical protein